MAELGSMAAPEAASHRPEALPDVQPTTLSTSSSPWTRVKSYLADRQLHRALTEWMRWIVVPSSTIQPTTISAAPNGEHADYFPVLLDVFRQGRAANLQKYCLAILQASLPRLTQDVRVRGFAFEVARRAEYEAAYARFATLFEIVVIGRYVNQVEECLGSLPRRPGAELVGWEWWLLLFTAGLRVNHEQVRKVLGGWLLANFEGGAVGREDVLDGFLDAFMTWSGQGQLLWASLRREGRLVLCAHGDALAEFWGKSGSEGLHVMVIRWLCEHAKRLNQHATVFVLRGLAARPQDAETAERALQLAATIGNNFGPFPRYLCRRYCSKIVRESRSVAAQVEQSGQLQELIEGSLDLLDGDVGPYILRRKPENLQQEVVGRADSIYERYEAKSYVSKDCNGLYSIHWDHLHRFEPHQSCWRLLVEIWPHWMKSMGIPGKLNQGQVHFAADGFSRLFKLSRSKTFLWTPTARTLWELYTFTDGATGLLEHPMIEQAILDFIQDPPEAKPEFLLDAALASGALDIHGQARFAVQADETLGNAYIFDILNQLAERNRAWGVRLLNKILEPWLKQKLPVPMISKWKRLSQLQACILLMHSCVHSAEEAESFLGTASTLLIEEPNPQYRFLLEWMFIYLCTVSSENKAMKTLIQDLESVDPMNPNAKMVASQIRIAALLLVNSPRWDPANSASESQSIYKQAEQLMTALATLINSGRIAIRFEAQARFAMIYEFIQDDLRVENHAPFFPGAQQIFASLWKFVTQLEKYKKPPEERVLTSFDPGRDMNLSTLFEGGYLYIANPQAALATTQDFRDIAARRQPSSATTQAAKESGALPLGALSSVTQPLIHAHKLRARSAASSPAVSNASPAAATAATTAPLQTKSLLPDLSELSPSLTLPHASPTHSAPILVASLVASPVNLGGLSRAANVFGVHALHLPSLAVTQTPAFRGVSVDSSAHIPLRETPVAELGAVLRGLRRDGWSIVGCEQTSGSVVIGTPWSGSDGGAGGVSSRSLPRKSVIVMGAERTGIPAEILVECDVCVEIRQWGVTTRSLNVQTAAACVLFEWRREWGDGAV